MVHFLHFQPLRWATRSLGLLPGLGLDFSNGLLAAPTAALPSATSGLLADITITGRVIDKRGEGLPGVNVVVKGTTNGAPTDPDGRYNITAPNDATLVFSFIGYVAQEAVLNGRKAVNISLAPDNKTLSEVVVVGYGVQEKKLLTTSIA